MYLLAHWKVTLFSEEFGCLLLSSWFRVLRNLRSLKTIWCPKKRGPFCVRQGTGTTREAFVENLLYAGPWAMYQSSVG